MSEKCIKRKRMSFWDILMWISLGIVFLYFFLKIIGVLNSLVEADIITFISGSYFVGRHTMKLENRLERIECNLGNVKERIGVVETNVNSLNLKIEDLEKNVDSVNSRVDILESKF